ncbi:2-dehydro-3-deoxyphosphogluconate aldolase/(4S)-4-hydroxy-2-oxoglutarate aldolase [Pontibacter ummariensis]|uniref:2-dehydro-3-deoxyphosphogluconate aldolase / (4S)-4-hydroxy-2-oxoglutarate aldolase n=1 Tax=Pontibacter ummariensis TaxID=1610492 RepID=A0A239DL35_9BACT|nr:bifunctional 4-hydroxy-2-oxoglutarate aldolase/2-dehydro-3-deoxy-phosphogluconate aldolase [Pontibacter ummariensis]PRY13871.1 2-dehydro-3-deoxyphosphogluconate aldolase/(4S)-4-hydroxy-2-oxoglutarate aldolase [Pontibacter ummariensis]SNS33137.1 2-dehydro-3-deoxyphosphogluconate aldolase / (4S)-4-hydroxy-2-oxoglutarate aldolase [Pontibacter ummariensis]
MASDKKQVLDQILKTPAIPVYYNDDPKECIAVLKACYAGGIRVFEFTNRGAAALDNFKALKETALANFPDLKLGIGTIKDSSSAEAFIAAGADFIVSPIMDAEVASTVHQHELLWVPGCMTPTEIAQAEKAGASLVKLFPGNVLGTAFLGAIKALFPDLLFMPTGGVAPTEASIKEWFTAGVKAVGLGSKLFERDKASGEGHEWLSKRCAQMLEWAR